MNMGRIAFMLPEMSTEEEVPSAMKTPRGGQVSPHSTCERTPKSAALLVANHPVVTVVTTPRNDRVETFVDPAEEEEEEEEEAAPETCCICLEPFEDDGFPQHHNQDGDQLPCRVPSAASLPCACQARVARPARVHEACLRSWLGACARRSARSSTDSTDPNPTTTSPSQGGATSSSSLTCPLCRAPLSETVAKSLELAARVRAALKQCPRQFAATPLVPADGVIRCVVKVHDKHPSHALGAPASKCAPSAGGPGGGPGGGAGSSPAGGDDSDSGSSSGSSSQTQAPVLLSLYVEGDDSRGIPLLVARAPKVLGSSRLATKFDICYGPRPESSELLQSLLHMQSHAPRRDHAESSTPPPPPVMMTSSHTAANAATTSPAREKLAAVLSRNCLGTRWTVTDPATNAGHHSYGKRRCAVDYEANRFANRPRAMHVDLDNCAGPPRKLRSRAPEYSPRLHGFCLDFFGRARLASVRNFQIVDANEDLVPGDEEARCLLLFGRWSSDEFHLDVKAPFSLVDAFAIAVSSFATKIATI